MSDANERRSNPVLEEEEVTSNMKIEVLYFEGCPNHVPATDTLHSLGRNDEIHHVEIRTQAMPN